MSGRPVVLLVLAFLLGAGAAAAGEEEQLAADLALLRKADVATSGAGLLAYFKKRTPADATLKKIRDLIDQLGSAEFGVREKATNDLVDMGAIARPLLAGALKHTDLEVRRRAQRALDRIGSAQEDAALLPAAARVLAQRKPPGAAAVLLDFLPNVEQPEVAGEVARVLAAVALDRDGKPEPAVLLALSDRHWLKRFAAADALARAGGAAQRKTVRKLLADPDPGVRRRVALSLLDVGDKEAVPALIALLEANSREDAVAAEDVLTALADEAAPKPPVDDSAAARARYRKEWEAWWKGARDKIDLAKITWVSPGRGYTLIATVDLGNVGKVQELDGDGKARWTIAGLRTPIHASKIRRDRVLVCESGLNRVTERDLKGKVLWEKSASGILLSAQRLPNGHTVLVTRSQIAEVDRLGHEVRTITRPNDVLAARRHRDGKITLVSSSGNCVRLDRDGRQLSSFFIGHLLRPAGFQVHFLPGGGLVVPDYRSSTVREYNASGAVVWEKALLRTMRPSCVARLPNGHTLVGSQMRNRLIELDKAGNEVSNRLTDGRLLFIDSR
jgi:HEAT repeat protein